MSAHTVDQMAERARGASVLLANVPTAKKNAALKAMAAAVLRRKKFLLSENAKDVEAARKRGLSESVIARLTLNTAKIEQIAESIRSISRLPDPIGREISRNRRPNGLLIRKVRVPIGVILIIYESRPNVTADCMALCLKSGNSVILKGGSEAEHSNAALFTAMNPAAIKSGVPAGAFERVGAVNAGAGSRTVVRNLLSMNDKIDLVIPRGGEGLIRDVAENSKIPVIKHYKGVCHVFVHKKADLAKAQAIVINAKVQNPAVCNAMETLLVDEAVAKKFLPSVLARLKEKGVEIRGCRKTRALVSGIRPATDEDWRAEYLDLILSVRVVKNLDEAVRHIREFGSKHSDAIVTEDNHAAKVFSREIDSACVFVNCSTRFNDGGEFGMGAEMGISTDKLHARGPMGLEELTTYKYVVTGSGQVRK